MIDSLFVISEGTGAKAIANGLQSQNPLDILDENLIIKQNYDSTKSQIFLIKAFTTAATSSVQASVSLVEFE